MSGIIITGVRVRIEKEGDDSAQQVCLSVDGQPVATAYLFEQGGGEYLAEFSPPVSAPDTDSCRFAVGNAGNAVRT
ncbi:MAG: hypothetical protein H6887_09505 [Hoeflea sp.]|nr:hypothetical protein [Hoeflea sp.]